MTTFEERLARHPIRRILAVVHPGIGDAVMLTAAMRWIKKKFPNAELVVNTEFPAIEFYRHCPYVDRTVQRDSNKLSWIRTGFEAGKVDLCINFYTINNANRWAKAAAIPLRIGMGTTRTDHLLHVSVPWRSDELIIPGSSRRLLATIGVKPDDDRPDFTLPDIALKEAEKALNEIGLWRRPFVAMNIGASADNKCWPLDKFMEIKRLLCERAMPVVMVGGNREAKILREAESDAPILAGKLSILGSAALLQHAKVLVTNDSGLMHVAGGVGTPTVSLVGAHYGRVLPPGNGHALFHFGCDCPVKEYSFCSGACLQSVPVEPVWQAIETKLAFVPTV